MDDIKHKKISIIFTLLFLGVIVFGVFSSSEIETEPIRQDFSIKNEESLKEEPNNEPKISTTYLTDIEINDTDPTKDWSWAVGQSWCEGSGTKEDPYVIEDVDISASVGMGNAIEIKDSRKYFKLNDSVIHDGYFGMELINVSNGIMDDVEFENNYRGIEIQYVNDTLINDVYIHQNSDSGIYMHRDALNVNITNSVIVNNSVCGIEVGTGSGPLDWQYNYSLIKNNELGANDDFGMFLCASNNITIEDNYFSRYIDQPGCHSEDSGIDINGGGAGDPYSENLTIINNKFYEVPKGLDLSGGFFGVFEVYYNNFTDNYDYGAGNGGGASIQWDDGVSKGNYWSDYVGSDHDLDGIGDDNYTISCDSDADRYPIWNRRILQQSYTDVATLGINASDSDVKWCSGSGTKNDPFLIKNFYTFDANLNDNPFFSIDFSPSLSDVYIEFRNVTILPYGLGNTFHWGNELFLLKDIGNLIINNCKVEFMGWDSYDETVELFHVANSSLDCGSLTFINNIIRFSNYYGGAFNGQHLQADGLNYTLIEDNFIESHFTRQMTIEMKDDSDAIIRTNVFKFFWGYYGVTLRNGIFNFYSNDIYNFFKFQLESNTFIFHDNKLINNTEDAAYSYDQVEFIICSGAENVYIYDINEIINGMEIRVDSAAGSGFSLETLNEFEIYDVDLLDSYLDVDLYTSESYDFDVTIRDSIINGQFEINGNPFGSIFIYNCVFYNSKSGSSFFRIEDCNDLFIDQCEFYNDDDEKPSDTIFGFEEVIGSVTNIHVDVVGFFINLMCEQRLDLEVENITIDLFSIGFIQGFYLGSHSNSSVSIKNVNMSKQGTTPAMEEEAEVDLSSMSNFGWFIDINHVSIDNLFINGCISSGMFMALDQLNISNSEFYLSSETLNYTIPGAITIINDYSLTLIGSSDIHLENNVFNGCGGGLEFGNDDLKSVMDGEFPVPISYPVSGIKRINLIDNNITGTYSAESGIRFEDTANGTIEGNTISKFDTGMKLISSGYFTIKNNIIKNSKTYGVYADSDNLRNLYFGNYFLNNSIHVTDFGLGNDYNNSQIGNYWDDYEGFDKNDDGIGDSPYAISSNENYFDYLPIWDDGEEPTEEPDEPTFSSVVIPILSFLIVIGVLIAFLYVDIRRKIERF